MKKRSAFYGGLFLVTAATLMLQLVQTRLLSVAAWYYLAFFVISIAMFGLAAGAVWVYLRRERFGEATLSHDLAYFASAFAVSAVVSLAVQLTLPVITKATLPACLRRRWPSPAASRWGSQRPSRSARSATCCSSRRP